MARTKEFVIEREDLMKEWNWDKNNKLGLFPDKLSCGSATKAWWTCINGHSFFASISHKANGRGCPYCSNHKVLPGYNDLQTKYPHLAKEWNYEKNYPLKPTDVIAGSHIIAWWTCPHGHEYNMQILRRTQGCNCPVCSGKRVISGINDIQTTHPNLMKEWNWGKNNTLGLNPNKISFGSTKKVWWKCHTCGHEWQTSPNSRTKTGCPCCASKVIVKGKNDLETLFPEIAKRWHPLKNKLKPCEVTPFSNKKVWWTCNKDDRHEFQARIYSVTQGITICPICSNQKIIIGVNDFQTTNPDLMKEWNWERNNQANIYPTAITKGINKKVWWKCNICGHEWQATVGSRSGDQRCGCPECKKDLSSSFPEKAIAFYLSKFFQVKENQKFTWLGNSELDIYLDEIKIAIEYDGKVWHKNPEKDIKKDTACSNNGITLIRIREKGCPKYESSSYKLNRKSFNNISLNEVIEDIFKIISQLTKKIFDIHIDIDYDYIKILEKIASGKKSFSVASSDLINSWNYKKNGNISPESIRLGIKKKVWWICSKGHEWQATVNSRYSQKCGCPICAGQKILSGENDLQTLYPSIAKEWDNEKNTKKANQVRPMDNKNYWWICSKCGKSYQSSPAHRVGRNSGCPDCARHKTAVAHYKKVKNIDTGEIYESIKSASEKCKINAKSISNCCRGVSKTAGGYHWKFANEIL